MGERWLHDMFIIKHCAAAVSAGQEDHGVWMYEWGQGRTEEYDR